jgi:Ca2+/Na+ antiporter
MSKFIKYLSYILFGLTAIITILFFLDDKGMLDTFLGYAYILLGFAIISAVGLPLLNMLKNPKGLKSMLKNLLVIVVVVVLAYLLASGDPLKTTLETEPTASTLKLTDTGLIITYFLFAASVIAIVGGGLVNLLKKR